MTQQNNRAYPFDCAQGRHIGNVGLGSKGMKAKFKAKESFVIEGRGFVVSGEILEGTIEAGMLAHVPFNSSLTMSVPIRSVDVIDYPNGRADVGLTLECKNQEEQELLEMLEIGEEVLPVTDERA